MVAKKYKSADPGARITPQEEEFRIPIVTSNTVSSAEGGIMDLVAMGYGREGGTRMFYDVSVASSGTAALFNANPSSNANLDFQVTCRRRERRKELHYGAGLKQYSTRRNIPVLLKPFDIR